MTELVVRPLDPVSAPAADLVAALDAHQSALYPPASTHRLPPAALAGPGAVFLGAYLGGRLVGCGGYVTRPGGYAELKRLYVRPEARRRGVAGALLAALEARAAAAGVDVLRVETGVRQPESERACARAGFARRGPFGDYADDPLSVFMEKRLGRPTAEPPAPTGGSPADPVAIGPAAGPGDVPALVALVADAVADGASVGFLAPFDPALAAAYWGERLAEVEAGRRVVLAARAAGRVVGAVQLALAADQNAAHRAEVQRLLVLRSHRGRGVGTALMRAAEAEALGRRRTLLVLNTRAGGAPEALYTRLGYERAGVIPDFARDPDGTFNVTTVMFRRLRGEDGPGGPQWDYAPVRRLLCSVEQSLTDALAWAAFEPNAEPTWARVRQVVADDLAGRWRAGDLAGSKPQDAFFVRCDRSTMTQADLDAGRLVCLVGVAPVRPAEFVVLRIGQWTADAKG